MIQSELFAKTAVASWKINLGHLDKLLAGFSDGDLQKEIAPGKNRVYYLIGHLASVHDRMFPLLRLSARKHEDLDEDFLTNPDRSRPDRLSAAAVRQVYNEINTELTTAMAALSAEAWLERHEAISAEDFAKEPLRNRLAVLLSRTAHVQFHTGQIRLAVKKGGE
jgi:hypothetical protein